MDADDTSPLLHSRSLAVFALVAVACLAGRWPAMQASLWVDELHTSWVVADGWQDVVGRAHQGNQSPFYFLLLRGWVGLVGSSELTLRLPSLLSGIALALGVTWLTIRWTRDHWLGLLAGLLIAGDSRFIFYATEARPYALLQSLAFWHILAACRRWESPTFRRRLEFWLTGAGIFYLHYTGALVWGASLVIALFVPRAWSSLTRHSSKPQSDSPHELPELPGDHMSDSPSGLHSASGEWTVPSPRHRLGLVVADGGILLLLCSPTFAHLLEVLRRRDAWNSFIPSDPPLFGVVGSLNALHFVGIPLAMWLLVQIVWKFRTGHRIPTPQSLAAMACWWLIPVLAAWVATRADVARLFFPRYMVSSAAGAVLLGALCLGASLRCPASFRWLPWLSWRSIVRSASLATLVVALLLDGYVLGMLTDGPRPLRREDWRGLAAVLEAEHSSGPPRGETRLLLVRSGLIEADGLDLAPYEDRELLEYCRYMFAGIYRMPEDRWQVTSVGNHSPFGISPALRREAAEREEIWLAVRTARARIPGLTKELLEQLSIDGPEWQVAKQWRFGNLGLIQARQDLHEWQDLQEPREE